MAMRKEYYQGISIHAPPRGATTQNIQKTASLLIFQFTPLREGRRGFRDLTDELHDFNSRPSARGDTEKRFGKHWQCISIHAPPRGATHVIPPGTTVIHHFNSRPSARGDSTTRRIVHAHRQFQFTPLREGRRGLRGASRRAQPDFNSRPSARGDAASSRHWAARVISIHAPPRGATTAVLRM